MRRERQFNPTGHLVMGLLIVALGVMFTLDNLGLLDARQLLRYWPVILIMIGVGKVSQAEASGGRFGGGILILIGSLFLIQKLGFLHVNIWSLWPLLLVIIGIRMIVERGSVRVIADTSPGAATSPASSPALDTSSTTSAIAILSQVDRKITSQAFQHAEITAFMGLGKLDLRDANLAGGQAVINVMVMMGGFELLVPSSWNVIIELTPIMAGVDDRRRASPPSVDAPRLFLRGIAIMGGIEVKD